MYLSSRMREVGGAFIQAESEIAAINMVFGAAAAGARAMTTSSSPGISLMQETVSYMAGCQLPCVIANIMRGGPGLGNIGPSQADYFQAVKGGGHGDYRLIVLAPSNVQEVIELTASAFDLADRYRIPVMILGDGVLGQMMEPVHLGRLKAPRRAPSWALTGAKNRSRNIIRSFFLQEGVLAKHNEQLRRVYEKIQKRETRCEVINPDAQVMLVSYGTTARMCADVLLNLRRKGVDAGLFRPVTLWPFPSKELEQTQGRLFISVEMSMGQFIEDVKLSVPGRRVEGIFKPGGLFFTVEEITRKAFSVIDAWRKTDAG